MKAKQVLYLGLILPVLFLSACSSTPSKSEAREALVSKLNEEEKDQEESIKLVSFEKIHEQSGEMFGVETYQTKFEAKLAFPEGWNMHCIEDDGTLGVGCKTETVIEPGGRKTIKGNLRSEKTSEGWKNWSVKSDFFGYSWQ
ncbi:MAG: hypothetical protein BRC41_14840 [Cyanobacteria bacterium QH_9_48_43]|nr:MAG: hypothetical protein BRC41_14840 [Cyanobacteria bacterium QH_9_48_43]